MTDQPNVPTRVFISYAQFVEAHSRRVRALAQALRAQGIDADLDQFHRNELLDWPRWCQEGLGPERSDWVLMVCTAAYRDRIEGRVDPHTGKGAFWEGALLRAADMTAVKTRADPQVAQVLRDLLTGLPLWSGGARDRRAFLEMALFGHPALLDFQYEGQPQTVAAELVTRLHPVYQPLADGTHPVVALIREVRARGEDANRETAGRISALEGAVDLAVKPGFESTRAPMPNPPGSIPLSSDTGDHRLADELDAARAEEERLLWTPARSRRVSWNCGDASGTGVHSAPATICSGVATA